jgi:muconate cycloisomerase
MADSPVFRDEVSGWDQMPKFLLRLLTDEGSTGLGETPRGTEREAVEMAAGTLIGLDPLALNLKELPCRELGGNVYKGFEVAMLDLVGKARGMRVCELLGGVFRDQVATSYWAGRMTPEDSRRTANDAWDQGYNCLKIKDRKDIPLIERVEAIHQEAPDLRLIIDPMQAYDDVEDMIELSRRLEPFNIVCLEDPLPKNQLDWYVRLRHEAPLAVALHLGSPGQVLEAIKADAVDIINCSPSSIVRFVQMAEMAEIAGIPCWQGSGVDLGILDLAYIHSCAAARNCTIPSDILSGLMHVDDFVVEMPTRHGELIDVPHGPGLGGELDMAAVEEFLIEKGQVR